MNFHQEGLTEAQLNVLRLFGAIQPDFDFYLAGGTALSAYFGHRQSIDLDWFTRKSIADPFIFAQQLREAGINLETGQIAPGTLHGTVQNVRVSFLEFHYPLLQPLSVMEEFNISLAALDDIACMKLSAIAQRGSKKDFIDLYALVTHHRPLVDFLPLYQKKFGVRDISPVLYGLAYFDDAEEEHSPRMIWKVSWREIKTAILRWVKEIA